MAPTAIPLSITHRSIFWLGLALIGGLVIALLPLPLALLGTVTLAGTALISPVALLTVLLVFAPMRALIATELLPRYGVTWPLPLDIGQALLILWLAVWAAHKIIQPRACTQTGAFKPLLRQFWPLLTFVVAGGLSAFNAWSLSAWLTEWLKWAQMLVIALVVIDLGRTVGWRWFVFALVSAGLANALIGIYIYFGGSGALHLLVNRDNFRAFGTFGQPNPFGGFMGLVAPLALAMTLSHIQRLWRRRHLAHVWAHEIVPLLFYGLSAVAISAALIMSWSRGAWLGFGVSLAVMLFALPRRLIISLALALLLLAGTGVLAASGRLPATISTRLATIGEDIFDVRDVRGVDITPANYATTERLAHWQAATNMAASHPWLGVGLGNYEVAYPAFRLINWKFPLGHAHNYYLNVLAEAGIIGLVTYLLFVCALLALAWRGRRHPDPSARLACIGILGTWAYLTVHSLTDNLYVNNVFIHLSVTLGILGLLNGCIPRRADATRQAKPGHDRQTH
jgi:O-antigen ligase